MKILKSWLNDWINVENISSDDISEALESLGFEIESMTVKIPNYKNIIVGKVLEIYDHPINLIPMLNKSFHLIQHHVYLVYQF